MTGRDENSLDALERSRQAWNRLALAGLGPRMETLSRGALDFLISELSPQPGARLLDLGCGAGWAARRLAERDSQAAVVGIDLAEEFIDSARLMTARLDNVMFAAAPAEDIPWVEDYFDFVYAIDCAEFWVDPARAASELMRVTAYGGRASLLLHCFDGNPHTAHWSEALGVSLHRWNPAQWAALLENSGFTDVQASVIACPMRMPLLFQEDSLFRSRAELKAFQQSGSLKITSTKPGLPVPRESPAFPILP